MTVSCRILLKGSQRDGQKNARPTNRASQRREMVSRRIGRQWPGVVALLVSSLRTMNFAVAMRADFDASFPDLRSLTKAQDRVPGRPLGDLVVSGLRKRGFHTSDL